MLGALANRGSLRSSARAVGLARAAARQNGGNGTRVHQPWARFLASDAKTATAATAATAATVGAGGLLGLLQRNPFAGQVTIATLKTSVADLVVQKQVEKKDTIDWRRNALFVMFGGAYLGCFQWFVYVRGFQRLFPAMDKFCNQGLRDKLRNKAGMKALGGQILLDFIVIQPIMYFPVFYMFKTIVEPDLGGKSRFEVAFSNWKNNFFEDNLGMIAFWLPMDIVIYSVPLWLRLPLNHSISFLWCCILSIFRAGPDGEEEEGTEEK
mmetsp:Transcript_1847/g.3582  ORF Transcript_1847/g.3582 Transcript_1847/m.3582 type:complete len:267 (+) Transcript_1847:273-1073(+)